MAKTDNKRFGIISKRRPARRYRDLPYTDNVPPHILLITLSNSRTLSKFKSFLVSRANCKHCIPSIMY